MKIATKEVIISTSQTTLHHKNTSSLLVFKSMNPYHNMDRIPLQRDWSLDITKHERDRPLRSKNATARETTTDTHPPTSSPSVQSNAKSSRNRIGTQPGKVKASAEEDRIATQKTKALRLTKNKKVVSFDLASNQEFPHGDDHYYSKGGGGAGLHQVNKSTVDTADSAVTKKDLWYSRTEYEEIDNDLQETKRRIRHDYPERGGYCYRGLEDARGSMELGGRNINIQRAQSLVRMCQAKGDSAEQLAEKYVTCTKQVRMEAYQRGLADAKVVLVEVTRGQAPPRDRSPILPHRRGGRGYDLPL